MDRTTHLWRRLHSLDEKLTRPLTLPAERGFRQYLALGLAHSGDSFVWAALLAAAWFFGDGQWKGRALVTFAGLILAEVVVVIVKMSIRRPRPAGDFGKIYRRTDPFSFPSGHAARATMLSLLAWLLGPAAAFFAILAWSPVMVLSRIAIGIHYVFDVVAGIALGAILTVALVQVVQLIVSRT